MNFTKKQRAMIMIPLLIGTFIALLDETILNVAFAQLGVDLHVSISTIQWLGTAYMLTIGILVPVVAFLLKTFSTKKMFLSAMGLYVIGTIACGFSQSFTVLLIFRIAEAAGAGMLMPIMINTITEIFPPARRGTALGIVMMVVVIAPGIGPTISGLILQSFNWHYLFFITLPFAILVIILGAIGIKNVSELTKPKIDILSIVLSTIGFGGLIFGVCSIENKGFFNVTVEVSLLCATVGLILFSKRQLSLKQPMLELRAFKYPMFTLGTIMIFITFMIPFAINIVLPTYMQDALGQTPFIAGLILLPGCVANGICSPLTGRLYDKIGARPLLTAGFAVLSAAMLFFSHITASTNVLTLIPIHVCMCLGISLIVTATQVNSLNQLPKNFGPSGVAILSTTQQIAAAFGSSIFIGLMGTIQTHNLLGIKKPSISQRHTAITAGVDTAFTIALVVAIIGFILTFFIKRETHKGNCENVQRSE